MSVSEYAFRFSDLSRHTPALVATVRERVCRFIEGLNQSIRYSMDRELESYTPYQKVVEIARSLDGMRDCDREDREAKRPRGIGGFSSGHAAASAYHGRGYVSPPVHSTLPAASGLSRIERRGTLDYLPCKVISFLNDRQMVEKGCYAYLEYVRDASVYTPTVESVLVVRDYPDVFPKDLPSDAARQGYRFLY
ncbi:uncharacterized protein [Nicotiana tomentosiformis]|uniref:uncharacterized protein n=1 Tax=Nicotiana tomentosiformis TaxID=4098 RepID=UPI00388C5F99